MKNINLYKLSFIFWIEAFCYRVFASVEDQWNISKWGPLPKDTDDYTNVIYFQFSNTSNGMTVKQFENFVSCIREEPSCTLPISTSAQNPYGVLTDCNLKSGPFRNLCNILNKCPNASEILQALAFYEKSSKFVTLSEFQQITPILLHQALHRTCYGGRPTEAPVHGRPKSAEVWLYAIGFVTLISGCSLVGVSVMPLMARDFYQKLLTVMIGLAVGSLAGSAVFHLIPQTYGLINDSGNHDYLFLSLGILFGIWLFFTIERILKVVIVRQNKSKNLLGSVSSQAIIGSGTKTDPKPVSALSFKETTESTDESPYSSPNRRSPSTNDIGCGDSVSPNNLQLIYESQEQAIKASFGHEQKPKPHEDREIHFRQGEDSVIATVAWMIIFGDGFHNFIDGVSIGAGFQQSIFTGISISLAVMCEELPHELGDFAVLLNSGMTMKQALFYNFLSATTCYVGMVVGILLGEFTENSTYIFALAAGMFLYISLVDMVPEMNETASKAAEKGVKEAIVVLLYQNLGLFVGVFSLFFLAYYQDDINFG